MKRKLAKCVFFRGYCVMGATLTLLTCVWFTMNYIGYAQELAKTMDPPQISYAFTLMERLVELKPVIQVGTIMGLCMIGGLLFVIKLFRSLALGAMPWLIGQIFYEDGEDLAMKRASDWYQAWLAVSGVAYFVAMGTGDIIGIDITGGLTNFVQTYGLWICLINLTVVPMMGSLMERCLDDWFYESDLESNSESSKLS